MKAFKIKEDKILEGIKIYNLRFLSLVLSFLIF